MPVVPSVLSPSHPLTLSPSPILSGLSGLSLTLARARSLAPVSPTPSLPAQTRA